MHQVLTDIATALGGQDDQLEQAVTASSHTKDLPFMSTLDVHGFGVIPLPLSQRFFAQVGPRAQLSAALAIDTELPVALCLSYITRAPSGSFSFRHSAWEGRVQALGEHAKGKLGLPQVCCSALLSSSAPLLHLIAAQSDSKHRA